VLPMTFTVAVTGSNDTVRDNSQNNLTHLIDVSSMLMLLKVWVSAAAGNELQFLHLTRLPMVALHHRSKSCLAPDERNLKEA
jgi:hypothetical protein